MINPGPDGSQCTQCSLVSFCFHNKKICIEPKRRLLKRKEILHFAEEKFINLYAVQSGALKAYETTSMGGELIRGFYFKDEVYGYEGIYKGRYAYSTVALTDTVICEISYQDFLQLIQSQPELLNRILHLMSQQLTADSYLKFLTAQQRVASFILDLSARLCHVDFSSSFLFPMSYQDIGNYLGLATETVSRVLSSLRKNQLISIENKLVTIIQLSKLQRIADVGLE